MAARFWIGPLAALALIAAPSARAIDNEVPVEAIYEFLKAEVAAQRGDIDTALAIYFRIARELRDPQVARRAVEAAVRARAYGPALDASALLLEIDPESSLAREIIASLLANDGNLEKAAHPSLPEFREIQRSPAWGSSASRLSIGCSLSATSAPWRPSPSGPTTRTRSAPGPR